MKMYDVSRFVPCLLIFSWLSCGQQEKHQEHQTWPTQRLLPSSSPSTQEAPTRSPVSEDVTSVFHDNIIESTETTASLEQQEDAIHLPHYDQIDLTPCSEEILEANPLLAQPWSVDQASPQQTICIVSHYNQNLSSYGQTTAANHRAYGQMHGYHVSTYKGQCGQQAAVIPLRKPKHPLDTHSFFQKRFVLLDMLSKEQHGKTVCDWILWIDSDAIFTDMDKPLTDWIDSALESGQRIFGIESLPDILFTKDIQPFININSGVMFLRNTASTFEFVLQWIKLSQQKMHTRDQPMLWKMVMADKSKIQYASPSSSLLAAGTYPVTQTRWVLFPQRPLNGFFAPSLCNNDEFLWLPGDFILHFAGVYDSQRTIGLQWMAQHALERTIINIHPCDPLFQLPKQILP